MKQQPDTKAGEEFEEVCRSSRKIWGDSDVFHKPLELS